MPPEGPSTTDPFDRHPTRRYAYAWRALHARQGRHLDVGCNEGEFLHALSRTSALDCHGVDAHAGYLDLARARHPTLALRHVPSIDSRLPYPDAFFASVTLLDTLEHVRDEDECLGEIRRVLEPGGLLVVTVPRRHLFSFMDPDNAKYDWPRLHRWVYARRFGRDAYHERFVDLSNGLRGDIAAERTEHRNYADRALVDLLRAHGLDPVEIAGANLFWRFFHVPALLTRSAAVRRLCERGIYWDGRAFASANLFVTARASGPARG